jgi:uncharacterized protein (DUF1501 family)
MPRHSSPSTACESFCRAASCTRRQILQVGGLGWLGLLLPDLLRAQTQQEPSPKSTFGRAKSIIVLYLHGGHAQQETWDPKPDAPSPARGEFGAIATSVPGIHVGELLPRSAKMVHKLAVIRSLSHPNANHVQASLAAMTGHAHPPSEESRGDFPPSPSDFPPFGAVLDRLRPARKLPTWVQVGPLMRRANGTVLHGQSPGFLGSTHSPLVIDQDLRPNDVRIDAVSPEPELSLDRLTGRRDLLKELDGQRRQLDQSAETQALDAHQQRALNLLTSPAVGKAFQLGAEPPAVRDGYGRTTFGQSCLLARRLAEAGVPVVNVHYCRTPTGSWDTHGRHFSQMKDSLCPTFDRAFAGLVADLDQRGLLGQTLVLATAEFGRTPKVNSSGGRDHWPWVYSVALAGGGAAAGVVYGASDKIAAYPTSHPHDPRDLAATVYHLLGVSADRMVYDLTNRPYPLVIGEKIDGLLA